MQKSDYKGGSREVVVCVCVCVCVGGRERK